jgi:cell division topological specificity factor
VLEFFRRLFAPEPRSSDTAKERLRLVLLSDHLSLAPEVVEALKRDLLAVISRYLEIDPALADVTFEQREREVAMLASIPIMGVRERSAPVADAAPVPPSPPAAPEAAAEPAAPAQPEDEAIMEPAAPLAAGPAGETAPEGAEAEAEPRVEALQAAESRAAASAPQLSASARRRRRKKAAAALLDRPAHGHVAPGFEPA